MTTRIRNFLLLALMVATSCLAIALTPTQKVATHTTAIDLDASVPASFGNWHLDAKQPVQLVNPVQNEVISRIYSQTLTRTYINSDGYRIMLSLAYGDDQRSGKAMAVHFPEVCYPAQGFSVTSNVLSSIATPYKEILVRRLETMLGESRHEPVTYWITLGDDITLGGFERRIAELRYGLRGEIPDGLLFRVSSIDADSARAFEVQAEFVRDLLGAIPDTQRVRLAGKRDRNDAASGADISSSSR